MKFIMTGDVHARSNKPSCRIDDPKETIKNKFLEINKIKKDLGCSCVISPGDLFDSSKPSWGLATVMYRILKDINFISSVGNHDLGSYSSTSDTDNTAVQFFNEISALQTGHKPLQISDGNELINIYSLDYNDDPYSVVPSIHQYQKRRNILIVHQLVMPDDIWSPLFGHAIKISEFEKKIKPYWDLVLCGDYHGSFIHEPKDDDSPWIVNAGVLYRTKINELDRQPGILIYDSKDNTVERFELKSGAKKEDILDPSYKTSSESNSMGDIKDFVSSLGNISKVTSENIVDISKDILIKMKLEITEETQAGVIKVIEDLKNQVQTQRG